MGQCIDRLVLTALGAAGLYALFLGAGIPIPVSCLLAFGGTALARRLIERRPRRYRATRAQAEAAVLAIALMPEAQAEAALRELTGQPQALCALRHPGCRWRLDDMYALWRASGDGQGRALIVTCPAEPDAARAAKGWGYALTDSRALEKLVRQTGRYVPPEVPSAAMRQRLQAAVRNLIDRPPRLRAALYGLSLLAMYVLTGGPLYLPAAMAVLFITGTRWLRARA